MESDRHKSEDMEIRVATEREVDTIFRTSADSEQWNAGVYDPPAQYAADPTGFFVNTVRNQVVAIVSGVRYDDNYGFIGFYIVPMLLRKRGYGLAIFRKAMEHCEGCNVALDGVLEQVQNYEKSGFVTDHLTDRFVGPLRDFDAETIADPRLVAAEHADWKALLDFDRQHFPAPREAFLSKWIKLPRSHAYTVVENGQIRGFGCIRLAANSWRVGPLFAESQEIALLLMKKLVHETKCHATSNDPQTFALDAPVGGNAERTVQILAPKSVFRVARMYTKGRPAVKFEQIYGFTSLELG